MRSEYIENSDIDPIVKYLIEDKGGTCPSMFEVSRQCHYTASQMRQRQMHLSDTIFAFESDKVELPGDIGAWCNYHYVLKELGFGIPEPTLEQKIKHWFINLFA